MHFITAFDQYAIPAFDVHAFGDLRKLPTSRVSKVPLRNVPGLSHLASLHVYSRDRREHPQDTHISNLVSTSYGWRRAASPVEPVLS